MVRMPRTLPAFPFPSHYLRYGVSNHMGVLGGGHYTATCLDDPTSKWFNFNDSTVSEADVSETQSSVAYVLFYKQRSREPVP